jgi:hypothetical protein
LQFYPLSISTPTRKIQLLQLREELSICRRHDHQRFKYLRASLKTLLSDDLNPFPSPKEKRRVNGVFRDAVKKNPQTFAWGFFI